MNHPVMTLCLLLSCGGAFAQEQSLQARIRAAAGEAHGQVSVSCALPGSKLGCDLNPHAHPPMQSVFKLPLGMAVLDALEHGSFVKSSEGLDQPIRFTAADREPGLYSPLEDRYPSAEVDVPLRELLRLAVSQSDNVAADLLLRLLGGPAVVEQYVHGLGIAEFQLRDNEKATQHDAQVQYRNWFAPAAAVALLRRLNDRSPLTPADTALVMEWMRAAPNKTRIKGLLPPAVEVLQKTGTSGELPGGGKAPATNDIGLISLPDGRRVAIAVFVTDSTANEAARDLVIAKIARAIWESAAGAKQPEAGTSRAADPYRP